MSVCVCVCEREREREEENSVGSLPASSVHVAAGGEGRLAESLILFGQPVTDSLLTHSAESLTMFTDSVGLAWPSHSLSLATHWLCPPCVLRLSSVVHPCVILASSLVRPCVILLSSLCHHPCVIRPCLVILVSTLCHPPCATLVLSPLCHPCVILV